jgi:hypothetical protein
MMSSTIESGGTLKVEDYPTSLVESPRGIWSGYLVPATPESSGQGTTA